MSRRSGFATSVVLFALGASCATSGEEASEELDASAGAQPDAPPLRDEPDAAPRSDASPASFGNHTVGTWCTSDDTPAFFVTVANSYKVNSCYPTNGIESALVVVDMASPPIGVPIDLSGDGSYASVCKEGQGCTQASSGQITFESFESGVGASGVVNLELPDFNGSFDASWCLNGTSCE